MTDIIKVKGDLGEFYFKTSRCDDFFYLFIDIYLRISNYIFKDIHSLPILPICFVKIQNHILHRPNLIKVKYIN